MGSVAGTISAPGRRHRAVNRACTTQRVRVAHKIRWMLLIMWQPRSRGRGARQRPGHSASTARACSRVAQSEAHHRTLIAILCGCHNGWAASLPVHCCRTGCQALAPQHRQRRRSQQHRQPHAARWRQTNQEMAPDVSLSAGRLLWRFGVLAAVAQEPLPPDPSAPQRRSGL